MNTERVIEPERVELTLDLGGEGDPDFSLVERYPGVPDTGFGGVRELYTMLGASDVEVEEYEDGGTAVRAQGDDALRVASALSLALIARCPGGEQRIREYVTLLGLEEASGGIE